jgi:excisionase family DNA binding protein
MKGLFFSTGQAARELGVSAAKIRTLCASGAIESTCTTGGQFRVSQEEIERLKRDGLPPVPRPLPQQDGAQGAQAATRARSNRGEVALLAPPSEAIIDSAEQVARLENDVRSIHLLRELEEGRDFFRDRADRDAERQAQREEAGWLRESQAAAEEHRQLWEAKWIEHGLKSVPRDAPRPLQFEVHQAVLETVRQIQPTHPDSITRELVAAAVARALAPWTNQQRIASAIQQACQSYSIPSQMKFDSSWKTRMQRAAAAAIADLRDGAPEGEMQSAAQSALAPLVREYESEQARAKAMQTRSLMAAISWTQLPGANDAERAQGKHALEAALGQLPITASQYDLERAQDRALAPVRAAVASRQNREARTALLRATDFRFYSWPDKLRRQADTDISEALNGLPEGTSRAELERAREQVIARFQRIHEKRERKSRLIDSAVRQIRPYVDRLTVDYEFDDDAFTIARDLEEPIRTMLGEELRGDETDDQVAALVRQSVREELDIR